LNLKTEDKEKGCTHEKIMAVMGKAAVVGWPIPSPVKDAPAGKPGPFPNPKAFDRTVMRPCHLYSGGGQAPPPDEKRTATPAATA